MRHHSSDGERPKVLVREQIAAPGLELLRDRFDVVEDFDSDLASIIGGFDAIENTCMPPTAGTKPTGRRAR